MLDDPSGLTERDEQALEIIRRELDRTFGDAGIDVPPPRDLARHYPPAPAPPGDAGAGLRVAFATGMGLLAAAVIVGAASYADIGWPKTDRPLPAPAASAQRGVAAPGSPQAAVGGADVGRQPVVAAVHPERGSRRESARDSGRMTSTTRSGQSAPPAPVALLSRSAVVQSP